MCEILNFILGHLTETASDDDTLDVSDDDFFMSGSSSDEEADDEWTDKSAKYGSQPTTLVHCRCLHNTQHLLTLLDLYPPPPPPMSCNMV
jgi:hypothetical protein